MMYKLFLTESDSQAHMDAIKTILAMISPEGENVSLGKVTNIYNFILKLFFFFVQNGC